MCLITYLQYFKKLYLKWKEIHGVLCKNVKKDKFPFADKSMIALIKIVSSTPIKQYMKHKASHKLFK